MSKCVSAAFVLQNYNTAEVNDYLATLEGHRIVAVQILEHPKPKQLFVVYEKNENIPINSITQD